jgi:hypothetical protein
LTCQDRQPEDGNVVRIDRVQTDPAQIRRGETVNLLATTEAWRIQRPSFPE